MIRLLQGDVAAAKPWLLDVDANGRRQRLSACMMAPTEIWPISIYSTLWQAARTISLQVA